MNKVLKGKHYIFPAIIAVAILVGLYLTSLYNYLLFHSIAEIFSIVIAVTCFILIWNLRKYFDNPYLTIVGIAYLCVGCIDLLHTLAYKGMGIFPGIESNLATQLWILGRYVESFSILVAALFIGRKVKSKVVLVIYVAVTGVLLSSIFVWKIFPVCYSEGVGLTPFKVVSEYIISCVLIGALLLLMRKREALEKNIAWFFEAAIVTTILSELAFTLYKGVYGGFNFLGHILKIISFYFIYRAIVKLGIKQPFALFLRKQKEEEENKLSNAEQRYRTVADFTYDWEWWQAPDGKYIYISPSCKRITGYTQNEFIDNLHLFKDIIVPQDREIWNNHHAESKVKYKPGEIQFRIRKKNGSVVWLEHVCQSVTNYKGVFLGFRASNRDITQRKKAEEDALSLKAELIHITRAISLGALSSSLAHELNQPLTAILSNAQAAQRFLNRANPDLDEVAESLEDIVKDDRLAAEIICKLRDLTKKKKIELSKCDLKGTVEEVLRLVKGDMLLKSIQLKVLFEDNAKNVLCDTVQIQQVILNLITNASEGLLAMDPHKRKMVIKIAETNADEVVVSVSDNGQGIDKENSAKIFEMFYTTKPGGLGMGLPICKSIIESHGGRIWAEHNDETGATFAFTLPLCKEGP